MPTLSCPIIVGVRS